MYSQWVLHQHSWRADPAPKHSEAGLDSGWLKAKGWVTQSSWVERLEEGGALPPLFKLGTNHRREWWATPRPRAGPQPAGGAVTGLWSMIPVYLISEESPPKAAVKIKDLLQTKLNWAEEEALKRNHRHKRKFALVYIIPLSAPCVSVWLRVSPAH